MAVERNVTARTLYIKARTGTASDGSVVYTARNMGKIRANQTDANIVAAANQLISLMPAGVAQEIFVSERYTLAETVEEA